MHNNNISDFDSSASNYDDLNQKICLKFLQNKHRQWLHYMDIATETGLSAQLTRICLEKLENQNQIESDGFGAYHYVFSVQKELSLSDERDLEQLEAGVRHSFYIAGKNFEEIRERRLYKKYFSQFGDFCQKRFGMSERSVNELIQAAKVYNNISSRLQNERISRRKVEGNNTGARQNERISAEKVEGDKTSQLQNQRICAEKVEDDISSILPRNKKQAVQLAKLPLGEQHEAWLEILGQSNGKPTVAITRKVVNLRLGKSDKVKGKSIRRKKKVNFDQVQKDGPIQSNGEPLIWNFPLKSEESLRRLQKYQKFCGAMTAEGALLRLLEEKGF